MLRVLVEFSSLTIRIGPVVEELVDGLWLSTRTGGLR
jgi:hypothetical protein